MAQRQTAQRRAPPQNPSQPAPQVPQSQQPYPQTQPAYAQAQQQQVSQVGRKRYLKMAEQGIILTAVIVAIVVVLFFLQDFLDSSYAVALDVIRLVAILILIAGLAYIGITGLREMRTG